MFQTRLRPNIYPEFNRSSPLDIKQTLLASPPRSRVISCIAAHGRGAPHPHPPGPGTLGAQRCPAVLTVLRRHRRVTSGLRTPGMATWRPLGWSQHAVRSPGRGRRSSAGPVRSCAQAPAPAPRKRIGNIWRLRDCVNEALLYEGNLWASETPKQRSASGSLEPSALAPNQAPSRSASPPPASGGAARPAPALCRRNSPCRPEAERRVLGGGGALWSPLPPGGRSGSPGARLPLPRPLALRCAAGVRRGLGRCGAGTGVPLYASDCSGGSRGVGLLGVSIAGLAL